MNPPRRRLAFLMFWLAGCVSAIKVPRRVSDGRRIWSSIGLTYKLLKWSMRLDRDHWDHWALQHDKCDAHLYCANCGY